MRFGVAIFIPILLSCEGGEGVGGAANANYRICQFEDEEDQAICVREDLKPLQEQRDQLIALAYQTDPKRAAGLVEEAQLTSESVYEYCVREIGNKFNCIHEKLQAEIDTLDRELEIEE